MSSSFAAEHAMAAVGGSVQTDACVAQEGCVTGGTRQSTAPGPRTWCLQSSTCAIRPARLHPSPRPRCLFRSGRAGRDEQIRQGARLDRSPACEAGIAPCSNDACGHVTVDIWRDASRAGMAWLCAARRPGLTRHGKDVWASRGAAVTRLYPTVFTILISIPVRYRILHLSFILHMSVPWRWLGVLRWSEVAAEVT